MSSDNAGLGGAGPGDAGPGDDSGDIGDTDADIGILLASQSDAHRIAPHRDPIQPRPIPSTYSSEARKTHDVIYF